MIEKNLMLEYVTALTPEYEIYHQPFLKEKAASHIVDSILDDIRELDSANTFFYINPPSCASYSKDDFGELLELLADIKGKFLLSCYASLEADGFTLVNNFNKKIINKNLAVKRSDKRIYRKTQYLIYNYNI